MPDKKKYYWLKLKRDFFKRHDTRIIESMENGEKYLLFYLKLLVESIDHEGQLRFSDTIPYNDKMLSTITNTDIDIVRSAVKVFTELNMLELFDDGTLFMNQVQTMIGDETEWAEKKRLWREKQRQIEDKTKTKKDNVRQEKELDIEKDKEIKIDRNRFVIPTVEQIKEYCTERNNKIDADYFFNYYQSKGWMIGKNKMKDWKSAVHTWEKRENDFATHEDKADAAERKRKEMVARVLREAGLGTE